MNQEVPLCKFPYCSALGALEQCRGPSFCLSVCQELKNGAFQTMTSHHYVADRKLKFILELEPESWTHWSAWPATRSGQNGCRVGHSFRSQSGDTDLLLATCLLWFLPLQHQYRGIPRLPVPRYFLNHGQWWFKIFRELTSVPASNVFEFDKRGRNRARGHRHSFKLPKQCCSKDVIEYFFSHRVIHELIERYDTIRDAILTCARKPTWVGLIYCMETTTKSVKTEKLKSKNGRGNFRNRGKLGWSFSWTLRRVELIFTARC